MNASRPLLLAVIAVLAASCASAPIATDQRAAKVVAPVEGKAVVYVVRPSVVMGSAVLANMTINGRAVAGLPVRSACRAVVDAGATRVSVTANEAVRSVTIDAKPNAIYFVRVTSRLDIVEIPTSEGERLLPQLQIIEGL